ncbi:hypothetical protein D9758_016376 [Tetrapyrgos nigripes]|uniref:Uncharacterized protein n=1 Tax=Tetrapyrgos nigripes TaxID=182062 RepID=A0A8H5CEV5_9AGAR|nr:hypothetical protein D9758_016376 [Tetrapyrgos nigripes]
MFSLASVLCSMVQPCPMEVRRFSLKTMSVQLGLQNQNQTPEQGQCFMPVPLLKQNSLFHDIGPMCFVQAPSLVPWMLEEVPLEVIGDRLLWITFCYDNAWGGMLWQVVIGLEFLWPLWDTLSSCYRLAAYSATIYWQDMEILKEILYFVCFGAAHLEKGLPSLDLTFCSLRLHSIDTPAQKFD